MNETITEELRISNIKALLSFCSNLEEARQFEYKVANENTNKISYINKCLELITNATPAASAAASTAASAAASAAASTAASTAAQNPITILEDPEELGGGMLFCKKCKKNNVELTQRQVRSADEPMTNFCLCRDCGAKWSFS